LVCELTNWPPMRSLASGCVTVEVEVEVEVEVGGMLG
jgi:hypothetical protein